MLPGTITVLRADTLIHTAEAPGTLVFNWNLGRAGNTLTITPVANFQPAGVNLTARQ